MVWDLRVFDWTAVAAVGQIVIAFLTWRSLRAIREQLELSRRQTELSQDQLQLTIKQLRSASERAEEARHEAVMPVLVVRWISVHNALDGWGQPIFDPNKTENVTITFHIENHGNGAALNVKLEARTRDGRRSVVRPVPALPVGRPESLTCKCPMERGIRITLSWTNLFGRVDSRVFEIVNRYHRWYIFELDDAGVWDNLVWSQDDTIGPAAPVDRNSG